VTGPEAPRRAFAGVRILDLSRLLPGAYCSLLFADLGAEVIKVEEPGLGDYARVSTPHWGDSGIGAYFLLLNRNKKSLALNLKAEAGKEVFRRLVRTADVLLESFRPGVMARLGLGWETLRRLHPGLVYCAISGYGQDGPYRDLVGHDINYMGYAGALSVTGPRDGPPLTPGVQVADLGGGALLAAFGIAAALHQRTTTGLGQLVDAAMTDGVVSWLAPYLGPFLATGKLPARGEERLNGGWVCYQVFETADGRHVTLGALEPKFWANFCRLIGREDLVPLQYAEGEARDRVEAALRAVFRTRSRDEWVRLLHTEDVCAGPVLGVDEVLRDPQLVHRRLFQELRHPTIGALPQVAFPVKMSESPGRMESAPPPLGAHSEEILGALGYDAEAIAALRRDGVV
jgi:crotonobetainyl-CoA:carnitine CoA-transferase CaiB-like acyl-CoA transferase